MHLGEYLTGLISEPTFENCDPKMSHLVFYARPVCELHYIFLQLPDTELQSPKQIKNRQKRQPVFVLEAPKTFVELILKKAEMPLSFQVKS